MQRRFGLAGIAFSAFFIVPEPADAASCRDVLEILSSAIKSGSRDDALAQLVPIDAACPAEVATKARRAYGAMLLREVEDMSARGAGDDRMRPLVEQAADHGDLWDAWWRLADLELRAGRYAAADQAYHRAIDRHGDQAGGTCGAVERLQLLRARAEEAYLLANSDGQGDGLRAWPDTPWPFRCGHWRKQAPSLLFRFGSAALEPAARRDLDAIAAKLRAFEKPLVRIVGHTDFRGTDSHNLALSQRRAAAVQRHLRATGLAARYELVGRGKRMPRSIEGAEVYPPEAIDRLNRRVEISWEP
jgi:outer membrane protein OmpA-like peptidoglycan-associated protein